MIPLILITPTFASISDLWPSGRGEIALIYYGPPSLASPDVGLERAIALLDRRVRWLNTADLEGATTYPGELCDVLVGYSHVIVKSNWDYVVDTFVRDHLWRKDGSSCPVTRSLQIAGSYPPSAKRFYDLLYYETHWYDRTFLDGFHPRRVHAFGVDVEVMRRRCNDEVNTTTLWDWLFVGAFADHAGFKRPERLALKEGRRLAIGKLRANGDAGDGPRVSDAAQPVVAYLEAAGVVVQDPVPWDDLARVFASAANLLVPDDWRGGGERAVLEARACGLLTVHVEPDNPKLAELNSGPLYSPLYYATQLEAGLRLLEAHVQHNASTDDETCGVAPLLFPHDPSRWCSRRG